MGRTTRAVALLLTLLFGAYVAVHASPPGEEPARGPQDSPRYVPGRILVKLRPGASIQELGAGNVIPMVGIASVPVPEGHELETVRRLRGEPGVEFAEPNYVVTASRTPDDPFLGFYQWNLRIIRAEAAWDIEVGRSDVTIAVLDTGADFNHPDLSPHLLPGLNLLDPASVPQDDNGHGSHVAGIAAAASNNTLGIAGVSWGARLLPVKLLDSFGLGNVEDLARGIIWAADSGARVINISGGTPDFSQTLQDAVDYAYDTKGVLIAAAVGNDGGFGGLNLPIYPAALPKVVGVAATDSNDRRAEFSERGPFVDVAAPGVIILSTVLAGQGPTALANDYNTKSGTSMSAPHVAGLAALLWSANPALTVQQVGRLIETTAQDLGPPGKDELYGAGRIDAFAATRAAVTGILSASPAGVTFLFEVNPRDAITTSVSLTNLGGVALDWTAAISPTVPWLGVSPASGHLEALGPFQSLALTAQPPGSLVAGTYTATLVFSGQGAFVQNSPLTLPVSLRVVERLEKSYFPLVLHGQVPGW